MSGMAHPALDQPRCLLAWRTWQLLLDSPHAERYITLRKLPQKEVGPNDTVHDTSKRTLLAETLLTTAARNLRLDFPIEACNDLLWYLEFSTARQLALPADRHAWLVSRPTSQSRITVGTLPDLTTAVMMYTITFQTQLVKKHFNLLAPQGGLPAESLVETFELAAAHLSLGIGSVAFLPSGARDVLEHMPGTGAGGSGTLAGKLETWYIKVG